MFNDKKGFTLYFNTNQFYPTGLYGAGAIDGLTNGGYMPSVPYDPSGTSIPYSYAYCTSGRLYYHLGASLEQNGSAVLSSDRDCNSATPNCDSGCSAYTFPFNGGSGSPDGVQKCNAGHAGSYCYDLTP